MITRGKETAITRERSKNDNVGESAIFLIQTYLWANCSLRQILKGNAEKKHTLRLMETTSSHGLDPLLPSHFGHLRPSSITYPTPGQRCPLPLSPRVKTQIRDAPRIRRRQGQTFTVPGLPTRAMPTALEQYIHR